MIQPQLGAKIRTIGRGRAVAHDQRCTVDIERETPLAVPRRVDDLDTELTHGRGPLVFEGRRVDNECVFRVRVVGDAVSVGESRSTGDVVGVGVCVEDTEGSAS